MKGEEWNWGCSLIWHGWVRHPWQYAREATNCGLIARELSTREKKALQFLIEWMLQPHTVHTWCAVMANETLKARTQYTLYTNSYT